MREDGEGGVITINNPEYGRFIERMEMARKLKKKQRRERIATACLQGLLANSSFDFRQRACFVEEAVGYADDLIEELDK